MRPVLEALEGRMVLSAPGLAPVIYKIDTVLVERLGRDLQRETETIITADPSWSDRIDFIAQPHRGTLNGYATASVEVEGDTLVVEQTLGMRYDHHGGGNADIIHRAATEVRVHAYVLGPPGTPYQYHAEGSWAKTQSRNPPIVSRQLGEFRRPDLILRSQSQTIQYEGQTYSLARPYSNPGGVKIDSFWGSFSGAVNPYSVFAYATADLRITVKNLAPPKAEIDVNVVEDPKTGELRGTTTDADDITLFSPGVFSQPVQATVRNVGHQTATFQLEVVPAGAATLDRTTIEDLASGASATITITPQRVSGRVNDVQIVARAQGRDAGREDMTIVNVVLPQHVKNANTPSGMPDRIPPRRDTPVAVQVTPDLSGSGQVVTLAVAGQDVANGTVLINGGTQPIDLTRSAVVQLQGLTQTEPGHAGALQLLAQVRREETVRSEGFSIAAIPVSLTMKLLHKGVGRRFTGIGLEYDVESDSGVVEDLKGMTVYEHVVPTGTGTGVLAGLTSEPLMRHVLQSADGLRVPDSHGIELRYLIPPGGTRSFLQVFSFSDPRTGAAFIPIRESGYRIDYALDKLFDTNDVIFTIKKRGVAAVVQGIAADAGRGAPIDEALPIRLGG